MLNISIIFLHYQIIYCHFAIKLMTKERKNERGGTNNATETHNYLVLFVSITRESRLLFLLLNFYIEHLCYVLNWK